MLKCILHKLIIFKYVFYDNNKISASVFYNLRILFCISFSFLVFLYGKGFFM